MSPGFAGRENMQEEGKKEGRLITGHVYDEGIRKTRRRRRKDRRKGRS